MLESPRCPGQAWGEFQAPPSLIAIFEYAVSPSVVCCSGLFDVSLPFQQLAVNDKIEEFSDHVLDFAVAHKLDEINIDWKRPTTAADPARAEELFAALSRRLKPIGVDLTASWTASPGASHALRAARLCRPYTDAVYVMSYQADLASFKQRFQLYTRAESEGGQGYSPEEVCPGVQFSRGTATAP